MPKRFFSVIIIVRSALDSKLHITVYRSIISVNTAYTHTHTHPFNGPFFRDYPGEPVPER